MMSIKCTHAHEGIFHMLLYAYDRLWKGSLAGYLKHQTPNRQASFVRKDHATLKRKARIKAM